MNIVGLDFKKARLIPNLRAFGTAVWYEQCNPKMMTFLNKFVGKFSIICFTSFCLPHISARILQNVSDFFL